ncbi:response regulator transcription factor [Yinghuangia sp. ASG 101]|uniref:response regulator n=1 Tax=Yinghuangia sp. ASG 101 TaxID=2896848 RepID=UPI001E491EAC|nr:response regulator transcription factor [Yinghuangia sp. ASG 101]UGQ15483.1 response regulator transcription factor [Yinghuangia sp. ASG 101]
MLVDSAPDMTVAGQAEDGRRAVELTRELRPDVVVMDIRMPGLDGIEATRHIADDPGLAGVRVLVLTTFDDDDNILAALRAGAGGFLVKDTRPAELLDAIRIVAAGDALLSPGPTARLVARVVRLPDTVAAPVSPSQTSRVAALSAREHDVLALVGRGLNNAEIGEVLGLSPLTVKTHVSRMMGKLRIRDRPQLVVLAYESGLVRPGRAE